MLTHHRLVTEVAYQIILWLSLSRLIHVMWGFARSLRIHYTLYIVIRISQSESTFPVQPWSCPPHSRHCCVIHINPANPYSISHSPGRADNLWRNRPDKKKEKKQTYLDKRNLSEFSKKFVRGIWRHLLGLHLKLHHTCRSCIYLFIYTFYSLYLTYKSTSEENRGKRGEFSAELTCVETSSNIWQDVMEGEKVTKNSFSQSNYKNNQE